MLKKSLLKENRHFVLVPVLEELVFLSQILRLGSHPEQHSQTASS
jgi:hypothetical protein